MPGPRRAYAFQLLLLAAGPLAAQEDARPPGPGPRATFAILDTAGARIGQVSVSEHAGGVVLDLFAAGLAPGRHGLHLHAVPACDPPDFTTAGGHFNPDGRRHGRLSPEGPHAGDLPNLLVNSRGEGRAQVEVAGRTLGPGPRSVGRPGTALIIHADPDDERSDPTGNAGARVACAVLRLP